MKYLLIIGAKSGIAKALAHKYASKGYNLYLAARNIEDLRADASDINIRYQVDVKTIEFDALDYPSHKSFYENLEPKPKGVIAAFGYLGNQKNSQNNFVEAKKVIDINFTGAVSILETIAKNFEARREGFIIGISSGAGDRGRLSNYIYGSAKAGFSTYLSGLRNRLSKSNVHVMTVKPGVVNTPMIKDAIKEMNLPAILIAKPEDVVKDIYNAQIKGKDILYTRWFWKYIMMVIKCIPEPIFKRLKL